VSDFAADFAPSLAENSDRAIFSKVFHLPYRQAKRGRKLNNISVNLKVAKTDAALGGGNKPQKGKRTVAERDTQDHTSVDVT